MHSKIRKSKILLSALVVLSGAVALSGCGSSTDSSTNDNKTKIQENSEKITLTLWHYYNGSTKNMLDDMINEFNETVGAEKNISIDAYSHSSVNDLASALVASARKEVGVDDMPDIFAAYGDTALLLDELGVIAPLDSYFNDEEISLYRDDFLEEGKFDEEGNLKILPVAKSTEALYVNNTDFQIFSDETGVQLEQLETWEGLLEVAEIYYNWTDSKTEEENDGRALFGIDSEANFMIVTPKQLGEEIYDYSGDGAVFGLSEEAAKKIWDNYFVPYIKGYYISQGSFRSDDIKSGDLLIYAGSNSSIYYFPKLVELNRTESYEIEGITLPYPYFEDGDKIAVQQGAGMMVSKTDEMRESASVEFLKWFTAPENNLEFAVSTGYMPVQDKALDYESVLEFTQEYSEEVSEIILSSLYTIYENMLPEYEFYSNKPFEGSYDARNVVRSILVDYLDEALEILETRTQLEDVSKEDVINELISDDSFKEWYKKMGDEINSVLK